MSATATQVEFARTYEVSRQLLYNAIRTGKVKVNSKKKVVLGHEITKEWIEKRDLINNPLNMAKEDEKDSTVSQADFAKICGVSRQLVRDAIKKGHIQITKDRRIIFNHEASQAWYKRQLAKQEKTTVDVIPPIVGSPEEPLDENKVDLVALQRQKIEQEIGKIKADRKLKELKYKTERGSLIEKETLASVLFNYLDALNVNMLTLPDMVVDVIIDKVKAGGSRGDIIKTMRDMIQDEVRNTKDQIKNRLK